MSEKITWKGGTLLAPVPPALVTCGTVEKPNALAVAWTGITCSDPPKTYISLRPTRYSYGLIRDSREFVINLPTEELLRAIDFCGVHSGRDKDKLSLCGLSVEPSEKVSAPTASGAKISLECRVTDILPLGSHDMFLADILAVRLSPDLIDEGGKVHFENAGLVAYSHGEYFRLGKKLGSFGFSVKKKHSSKKGNK